MNTFDITMCQPRLVPVFEPNGAFRPNAIADNLAHSIELMRGCLRDHRSELFLFPEFMLQGYATGHGVQDWITASVTLPGPETDALATFANRNGCYVAGAVYERHAAFPGRYWNTGFIISPDAGLALVSRKLYVITSKTRPGDVLTDYLDTFGAESLFPVLDSPLGKLGMLVAGDLHWPEMARALALRGAEIILNPSGIGRARGAAPVAGQDFVRQVRAWENLTYVAMANFGPFTDDAPDAAGRVPSEVCDSRGRVIARAATEDATTVTATIDLAALRAHRATSGANLLAQLQPALHAPDYAGADLWPLEFWRERPLQHERELLELERAVWRKMTAGGRFTG
jgi:predicted amidohydrolase